jgi:putative heme-binding domain-containing protein
VLAHAGGPGRTAALFRLAGHDPEPRVQAQAVRALADLTDPVLTKHRLDSGPGDARVAARLAALVRGKDQHVVREVVLALGRLRWAHAPDWLARTLTRPDPFLEHAAMWTLRRAGNWPALLRLLDRPAGEPIRAVALRAAAGQAAPKLVDGLIERLRTEPDPARRREYADALTRVYKKRGPQPYWGYRPGPRPANTVAWERTEAIGRALERELADPDRAVRLAVLKRMRREQIPAGPAALGRWLREETDAERQAAILEALRGQPAGATRDLLEGLVTDRKAPAAGRRAALALFAAGLDRAGEGRLLTAAQALEDGPVLAEALHQLAKRPGLKSTPLILARLRSPDPAVRAAALDAAAALHVAEAAGQARRLLDDRDAGVRRAAAAAAGALGVHPAREVLLRYARDADPALRRASLESLRLLREPRVVPPAVAALADAETQGVALACIADLGGPAQAGAVVEWARCTPSAEVLPRVLRLLTRWGGQAGADRAALEQAAADLQGASGFPARWHAAGPLSASAAAGLAQRVGAAGTPGDPPADGAAWQVVFATGTEARVRLGPAPGAGGVWLAYTDVRLAEPANVQVLAGSSAGVRVWLNGRPVYRRDRAGPFRPDADRFEAGLANGWNRLLVRLTAPAGRAEFHLHFRRKSTRAEHERLTQAALTRPGDPERGRKLFFDAARTQCVKCHRIGDKGERIGPELTGVGARFSRIHLIESILEPSRSVAPGYQSVVVVLKDGRVLTGVRVTESADTLTLGDSQGTRHVLARGDVEEQRPHPLSTMPEGLERQLSVEEFVDLIAFLASQKAGGRR